MTLPDASAWQLGAANSLLQNFEITSSCDSTDILDNPRTPPVATLVHPTGAAATFTLTPTTHGRSWVPRLCRGNPAKGSSYAYRPRYFSSLSLTHKSIAGPGLQDMDWRYSYGAPQASWSPCDGCAETSATAVTDPNGNVTNYTFGNRYNLTEGQLQKVEVSDAKAGLLRTTTTRYRAANAGPYAALIGSSGQARGDGAMAQVFMPADQRVVTQQGASFTWQADAFDARARATTVRRFSSLGFSRTETTAYADHRPAWAPYVLGLVETVTEGGGKVMVANTYHPNAATLLTTSRFGHLDKTMSYFDDGTLATEKDGLGHTTSYSDYKRGKARKVSYPDASSISAEVDNIGNVSWIIDANGYQTSYDYDAMGRIASITPPGDSGAAWNPTVVSFAPQQASEFGVAAGRWRQQVTIGNGRTSTYFDALWRPVYTVTYDINDPANPVRTVSKAFDAGGRSSFESYPQQSNLGIRHEYDALGRPAILRVDSELGQLVSKNTYGAGFRTTHTDARGNSSTSSFQVFDTPSEEAVTVVEAPLGVTVAIARDVFGKPLSISRGGGGASATRSYVYDQYERLCKTIEPETGAELFSYDAADNIAWRAPGLALTSRACDQASVGAPSKISFRYDAMNRPVNTSYGDGSSPIARAFWPDGLPREVIACGATWTMDYNHRRLPTAQKLELGGQQYALTTDYDANGSPSRLHYPSQNNPIVAQSVAYAPDAFGRPTRVGNFATAIRYHPDGAIASFTYGNGKVHSMTQNGRQLPGRSTDSAVLQDSFAYDQNGNVTLIADEYANRGTRRLGYDALDRLQTANAPALWGAASYDYDALDNIRTSTVGNRMSNYQYGARNLLDNLSSTASGSGFSYQYDARGNVTKRGNQAFVFDLGNRLSSAPNRDTYRYDGFGHRVQTTAADGTVTVSVYSPAGQLLFTRRSGGPNPAASTEYIYLHAHQIAEVKR